MPYFEAKRNLEFAQAFQTKVHELWQMEDRAFESIRARVPTFAIETPTRQRMLIRSEANLIPGYAEVRAVVARGVPRAIRLCGRNDVPITATSYPPAMVNGPPIPINFMMLILDDNSWGGVDRNLIIDRINQLIGHCEETARIAWRRLWNPFYWFYEALSFILKIPFRLIELTGFNVSKIEDQLIGKVILLIELLALIGIFVRLGATNEEIRHFVTKYLLK